MWDGVFFIIVVTVAVWGILTGYRIGFMRQISGVLGVAFGIVATRMIAPDFSVGIENWIPSMVTGFSRTILCQTLACGLIYLIVEGLISLCAAPLAKLVGIIGKSMGVLDSIGGGVFRLFKFLMVVSILYNVISDLDPAGDLTRIASRHDGNIVESVMMIAPALLDFPGAEEVAFKQQMEDAKKIS